MQSAPSHKNGSERGRDRGRTPGQTQKPPETWTEPRQNARPATKTALNVDGTGSERQAVHKNRPKRGRDRGRTPGRPQKPPETWTGPGQNAVPATKTARNVDGTGSERQASHKNRPKRGRERVRTPGRPQKPPETWTGPGKNAKPATKTA